MKALFRFSLLAVIAVLPVGGMASERAVTLHLGLIESHYRAGDAYRAETEILRFVHSYPGHRARAGADLVRAKLYYREGRYQESERMLISLLDRFPAHPVRAEAGKLLGFSLVRQGRFAEAKSALGSRPEASGGLEALALPDEDQVSPDSAVAWSTVIPGSGFFLLGEPGRGLTSLGLNLLFLGATGAALKEDLPGVALVLFLIEWNLYWGGREAVREAALERIARQDSQRRGAWLADRGESGLLRVGFSVGF